MSTLSEIEDAAKRLSLEERQKLMVWLASNLRATTQDLPEPRRLPASTIQSWIEEDVRDLAQLRRGA